MIVVESATLSSFENCSWMILYKDVSIIAINGEIPHCIFQEISIVLVNAFGKSQCRLVCCQTQLGQQIWPPPIWLWLES